VDCPRIYTLSSVSGESGILYNASGFNLNYGTGIFNTISGSAISGEYIFTPELRNTNFVSETGLFDNLKAQNITGNTGYFDRAYIDYIHSHSIYNSYEISSPYLNATTIRNTSLTSQSISLHDKISLLKANKSYQVNYDIPNITCETDFFYSGWLTSIEGYNNDYLGSSLDLNNQGDFLVIGGNRYNSNDGLIRTYHWDGGSWNQSGIDLVGSNSENLGRIVSLNSDGTILASAGHTANSNSGVVYIYDWIANSWSQRTDPISGQFSEEFGSSLSLNSDGDYIVVGSPLSNDNSGIMRVYNWADNEWSQIGDDISGVLNNESLGYSVDISSNGKIICGGGPGANTNNGITRAYHYKGFSASGILDGLLFTAQEDSANFNGLSVSLSQISGGTSSPNPPTPATVVFDSLSSGILISGDINNGSVTYSGLVDDINTGPNLTELNNAGFNASILDGFDENTISAAGPIITQGGQDPFWDIVGETISGNANEELGYQVSLHKNASYIMAKGIGGNGGNGIIKQYQLNGYYNSFLDTRYWTHLNQDVEGKTFDVNDSFSILAVGIHSENFNTGVCKIYGKQDNIWEQIGEDLNGQSLNESFGHSVVLNSDGEVLCVAGSEYGSNQGIIRQFNFDYRADMQLNSTRVTAENLNLDYYELPTSDPLVRGDVWRDQNDFLKISTGWTPAVLNTITWYDAADILRITSTNNTISQVNDKSGNNINLTVITAGATGPKTFTRTLNNLNVIEWCEPLQLLENAAFSHNQSATPLCFAIVFRADFDSSQDFLFAGTDSSANGNRMAVRRLNTNNSIQIIGGSGTGSNIVIGSGVGTVIEGQDYIVVVKLNASDSTIRLNGELKKTGNIGTNQLTSLTIGGNTLGASNINGYIAEFITFLDTDQQEKIEGYLAHKWNLTSNLPGNHLYKTYWPF
jgi:hypothetical protein